MTVHMLHAPAAALRWWHRQKATRRIRVARRVLRRNRDVLELPRLLRAAMADRATCVACGEEHALRRDGRVHGHGHGCPGGGELPAPITGYRLVQDTPTTEGD